MDVTVVVVSCWLSSFNRPGSSIDITAVPVPRALDRQPKPEPVVGAVEWRTSGVWRGRGEARHQRAARPVAWD
jgi:hypothetical protein